MTTAPAIAEPKLRPLPCAMCLAVALLAGPAAAQEAGVARTAGLLPTFTAEESLVDIRYRPTGGNGLESVTRLSPGVQYEARSGRLRGSLEYAANLLYRTGRGNPASTELQNSLGSHFVAEVVTNQAFVEAQANISQQTISAFGQQSLDGDLQKNSNRAEVLTASVTPSLRGQVGTLARYEARASVGGTLVKDSPSDSRNDTVALSLSSMSGSSLFGWTLSGTRQHVNFRGPASSLNERLSASVVLRPWPELQMDAKGGREVEDDHEGPRIFQNNYGAGLTLIPGPRTRIELDTEKRYFGNSGRVHIEHRLARLALNYNFVRDRTSGSNATGVGQPLTRFEQLYALEASAIPDPDLRRAQVLAELAAAGLDPNAIVGGGFLTTAQSLQQRHDLSMTLQGLRTSLSLQAFASTLRTLSNGGAADPLAGEAVHQMGYTGTITHRVTPQMNLTLLGSRLVTLDTPTRPGSDLKSASINLSTQTGPRSSTQFGARYSVFHSPTDPYHEAAVTGSLSLRF